ncbi:MAG: PTS cellobiose transporter subunit IIA [Lactococcus sp.]|jgi:PTS system cellobiose-specific IIA component|uniref:PTS cellobiose transporter subunit IIA n=3 Tax=Pseudolactococcus TaxID=3436058 RepID=A0A7L4WGW5_9LACT|nr:MULTISPECIES: PTS cellobiose transporter subunit IIA [Lactococcus]SCA91587.1 Phosphotransferase system, lactose/cellobiose-specific IIA subunit [Lactococcus piscium]MBR6896092.1 PTS cellobiose transporter subunit IIA [Lactococcus sp.]MCJ1969788.1 PTS cellobiose transporter subunit IIA [Lactococcus carnosus]MCJ1971356.1 PTS cellobiose transporter subunit IIA [Lactococcus carnosus]MCJ1973809.1 PTS cellobiose transporter subunit IIA [Lactococcus carnosus]
MAQTAETLQVIAFELILHSGNARTLIHEAYDLMEANDFTGADKKLAEANDELVLSHHAQTALLQDYAKGEEIIIEIIMVHAQDHLMTTMTLKEVAERMKVLYERTRIKP